MKKISRKNWVFFINSNYISSLDKTLNKLADKIEENINVDKILKLSYDLSLKISTITLSLIFH